LWLPKLIVASCPLRQPASGRTSVGSHGPVVATEPALIRDTDLRDAEVLQQYFIGFTPKPAIRGGAGRAAGTCKYPETGQRRISAILAARPASARDLLPKAA
jgi:hypothetical protein